MAIYTAWINKVVIIAQHIYIHVIYLMLRKFLYGNVYISVYLDWRQSLQIGPNNLLPSFRCTIMIVSYNVVSHLQFYSRDMVSRKTVVLQSMEGAL